MNICLFASRKAIRSGDYCVVHAGIPRIVPGLAYDDEFAKRTPAPSALGRQVIRRSVHGKSQPFDADLITETDDPLPLFLRIIDADPHWRHHLAGRQRPETRIETLSWQWRFMAVALFVDDRHRTRTQF
jgi:hypothetical protein